MSHDPVPMMLSLSLPSSLSRFIHESNVSSSLASPFFFFNPLSLKGLPIVINQGINNRERYISGESGREANDDEMQSNLAGL